MSYQSICAEFSGKAEEALQLTEVDLEKQTNLVAELTKTVSSFVARLTPRLKNSKLRPRSLDA